MKLQIKGLGDLRERIARADIAEVAGRTLAEGAETIAQAVRDGLAEPPGAGDHDKPWRRSGALHDSIGVQAEGLAATIGSNDPAAAPQEMGTARLPPRPFLAPAAATGGQPLTTQIGTAVAAALRGDST